MKRLSIGVRLTLWYLVIFALGEVVFGVGMWFILRDSVLDMVDDDIETQVDDLSHLLATQANDVSVSTLQALMKDAYGSEHWGDYLAIYTGDGQTLYQSVFLQSNSLLMTPQSVQKTIYTSREIRGQHFRLPSRDSRPRDEHTSSKQACPRMMLSTLCACSVRIYCCLPRCCCSLRLAAATG